MVQYFSMLINSLLDREDEGQGLVEYGLIIALVSIAAVAALTALGGGVSSTLGSVTSSL